MNVSKFNSDFSYILLFVILAFNWIEQQQHYLQSIIIYCIYLIDQH